MAYVSKEKKAKIAAALKEVVPSDWKYSLAVQNHSSIVMTISAAPVDLLNTIDEQQRSYIQLNTYYPENCYEGAVLQTIRAIIKALNTDNFNNSDSQSDYFHVGHYVDLNIGKYDRPFICKSQQQLLAA